LAISFPRNTLKKNIRVIQEIRVIRAKNPGSSPASSAIAANGAEQKSASIRGEFKSSSWSFASS
jgi:hypothetical protein